MDAYKRYLALILGFNLSAKLEELYSCAFIIQVNFTLYRTLVITKYICHQNIL